MSNKISIKRQKVLLTPLLQDTIKNLRKKYNKRGDDLSKQLKKGASYISQIENGKIKEIEFDSLLEIFHLILNMPNESFFNFMNDYINEIIKNNNKKKLVYEDWIHIFILQEKQFSLTDNIILFIKSKLEKLEKSPDDLVDKINENNQLDNWVDKRSYIPNKVYVNATSSGLYESEEFDTTIWVRYALDKDLIKNILNHNISTINYVNMYAIFRNLFEFEDNTPSSVHKKTEQIMLDNNFLNTFEQFDFLHSISRKGFLNPPEENTFTFYDDLIINYHEKYVNLKKQVFDELDFAFAQYYNKDSAYSCEKMEKVLENLSTDAGLVVAILSSQINSIPKIVRHDFFESYKNLLEQYIEMKIEEWRIKSFSL